MGRYAKWICVCFKIQVNTITKNSLPYKDETGCVISGITFHETLPESFVISNTFTDEGPMGQSNNKNAVIFIGIPASGKSSFYHEVFRNYVHISLDILNTRNKEKILLEKCIKNGSPFVIDNTNPFIEDRARYINKAKENNYRIIGYYFRSSISECMKRNQHREGRARVPDIAVKSIYSNMQLPTYSEGFDELYYVHVKNNKFIVENWLEEA